MNAKTKHPGNPGRFVPSALPIFVAHALPKFARLRRLIFGLARSSQSYAVATAGFGTLLIVFRMREMIW
jgi:hypothetical protein